MGFSSMDDFINETSTNGKFLRTDWNKNFLPTTPAVAGEWFSLSRGTGNPTADDIFNKGLTLSMTGLSYSSASASGIYVGGDTGTDTKHIVNASAYSAAATTMPSIIMAVDVLSYVRVTSVTSTAAQIIATFSLPRYASGAGVQVYIVNTNATAMGAATPTITLVYTNSNGVTSSTPTPLPVCKTAAANGLILYSGTGVGKYGPFVPLKSGDSGVRAVNSIQLSASYVSGEFAIVLCKPLFTLPMTTIGVASERDFMNQVPSLPRVYDGANIHLLLYNGAATPINSSFYGHIDVAWG